MTNAATLNIMNPKQLEKQVKILESRIAELQSEIDGLEKMRVACQILLGTAAELPAPKAAAPAPVEAKPPKEKPAKKAAAAEAAPRADVSQKIVDLLKSRGDGMTADEIYDELRGQGVELGGKSPVQTVYSTLEKHPELFLEAENGQWKSTGESTVPTSH